MTHPPFPAVLDSTIMSAVKSCLRKAELEFLRHYKSKGQSVHLVAGGAFASGMEAARLAYWCGIYKIPTVSRGVDPTTGEPWRKVEWKEVPGEAKNAEDAEACGLGALVAHYGDFECPADSAKSLERTMGTFSFALEVFPLGNDGTEPIVLPGGKRAIEFSFVHPLPISHPETGDPILYSGRSDQIVSYAGAGIFIEDDKTTSQLGASWSRQWDLRSQFSGYAWGCRESGIQVAGVLVRGLSILKTKYDKAEALTYRPEWQIERWYTQLLRDVTRLIKAWEEGYYDYNLDHACTEYGGCLFRQVCLAQDPTNWLGQFYERRKWDPVTRQETVLAAELAEEE